RRQPGPAGGVSGAGRAAVECGPEAGVGARTATAAAWAGGGRGLAMAAGRKCRQPSLEGRSTGAPADAVRSTGVGPPPLRAVLGMGLPVRSLHARAQAQAGLL